MRLTVLSVAYPFAPVGPDAVGGAEQVLSHLDLALVDAGHRSLVVACEGSRPAGELVATPAVDGSLDDAAMAAARRRHRDAVEGVLRRERVDVVHLHGIDFLAYLPRTKVPRLATLHLPPAWYPDEIWRPRPGVWMHCVSDAQRRTCPPGARLLPSLPNGVPVDRLAGSRARRRGFALMLGRVCPEKGQALALRAAREADVPLLVAGEVFPYAAHQQYFADEVRPLLDARRRFVRALDFARKRRLLSAARCVLVPSLAPETSSLVAMEALACGTPVVAFRAGALPEVVEHGRTGWIVDDWRGMARAMARAGEIDPDECRRVARERYSVDAMAARYLDLYALMAEPAREVALGAAA